MTGVVRRVNRAILHDEFAEFARSLLLPSLKLIDRRPFSQFEKRVGFHLHRIPTWPTRIDCIQSKRSLALMKVDSFCTTNSR